MCTAISFRNEDFYMGRTLDYERSYGEEITVVPRNFTLNFTSGACNRHFALIGMAHIADNFPLFYDAANEKGLCMAGLNFVGNAVYSKPREDRVNVAQYEFIPYVLCRCKNVDEAKELIREINLTDQAFSPSLPAAQLHWMIADRTQTAVVEYTANGLSIYDNPIGVMTNNPPFDQQLFGLNNYMSLSSGDPQSTFCQKLELSRYSRGMGALGLPGDLSSSSRFVRAAFTLLNSVSEAGEEQSVGQFFHILGSVEQTRGCCEVEPGRYEITIYTSCINASKGIYYYTTYLNRSIRAVDMFKERLDGDSLSRFPLCQEEQIFFENRRQKQCKTSL